MDGSTAGRNCLLAAWHLLPPAASFASGVFFRFVFRFSLPRLPATAAVAPFILVKAFGLACTVLPPRGGAF